jgi:cell division protein FtsZ
MPEITPTEIKATPTIKVVGVGGAGGAVINRMKDVGLKNVQYVAINTDAQALHNSKADVKVHIGKETTRGLGAGAEPSVGEAAARESEEDIRQAIEGADMAFVTLGAGGGTGSGAGPLVAQIARDMGILVVGVATRPFTFEGMKRKANADWAIDRLSGNVDALITVPNDRLLQTIDRRTPLLETFKIADDVLRQGVQGISEIITGEGLINLDFADVNKIMKNAGSALMGIGRASGENRAELAAKQAIESPLIEVNIDGARGIIFNVIGGDNMSMDEINEVAETIRATVAPDANIIFGAGIRPELDDEIIVTVVATGFDSSYGTSIDTNKTEDVIIEEKPVDEDVIVSPNMKVDDTDLNNDVEIKPQVDTEDFVKDEANNSWLSDEEKPAEKSTNDVVPPKEEELDEPAFSRVQKWFKKRKEPAKNEDDPHAL